MHQSTCFARLHRLGIVVGLVILSTSSATAQTFTGANFSGTNIALTNSIPPDTQGAVGINHYVEAVNGRVRSYLKNGTLTAADQSLDSFFSTRAGVATSNSFDPRVQFDRTTARWFLSANDNAESANSSTLLAVSPGSDPTAAAWAGFRFDMDAANVRWADFNTLGISRDWITIQNNMFPIIAGPSQQVSLLTIPKASLLAGNSVGSQYLNNLNPNTHGFTSHAVTDLGFGTPSATAYTLSSYNIASGSLRLSTVSGPTNTPTYAGNSILNVTAFTGPVAAPQSGSAATLDAGDARFSSNPVLVNGTLWAVQNVSVSSVNQIRLYRINPATNTVLSQLTIPTTAGLFTMYPSIAVNPAGDIVVGFSGTNSTQFVGAYSITGRFDGTSFTWGTEQVNAAGVSTYNVTFGGPSNRWGDYSATTLDPTDPGIFWSSQEFVSATDVWRIRNTELIPTRAGEIRWQAAANGNFVTGGSWINGAAPTSTDHAIFSRWGQTDYTITMPTVATSLDRLSVRQTGFTTAGSGNTVNAIFNIGAGGSLNLTNTNETTPSLAVAEFSGQAGATFSGAGSLNTQNTIVAGGVGSIGVLTMNTTWTNTGNVYVGGTSTTGGGVGTMNVDNGSNSTINGTLSLYNAATGGTANRVNVGTTIASNLTVGSLTNTGAGTVTPVVNLATSGSLLTVNGSVNSAYSGTIIGTGALTKSGSGTLTLSGANTYTGATTLNAGTLSISGNQSTANGAVTVNGGTLGGTGTIGGAVMVNTGAAIEAGNSVGTLTVNNNATVNSGGRLRAELGAGTTADRINLSGGAFTLDLKNGTLLSLVSSGFNATASTTFLLGDLSGTAANLFKLNGTDTAANTPITTFLSTGANTGTNTNINGVVNLDLSAFSLASGDSFNLQRDAAGDLVLVFTPVPEPGSILGLTAVVTLGIGLTRRFKNRQKTT